MIPEELAAKVGAGFLNKGLIFQFLVYVDLLGWLIINLVFYWHFGIVTLRLLVDFLRQVVIWAGLDTFAIKEFVVQTHLLLVKWLLPISEFLQHLFSFFVVVRFKFCLSLLVLGQQIMSLGLSLESELTCVHLIHHSVHPLLSVRRLLDSVLLEEVRCDLAEHT